MHLNRYYYFENGISWLFFFKGDHLLVIGGYRDINDSRQYLYDVEFLALDANDDECNMPELDDPIHDHASIVSSKGVITCGGTNGRNLDFLKKCVIQNNC